MRRPMTDNNRSAAFARPWPDISGGLPTAAVRQDFRGFQTKNLTFWAAWWRRHRLGLSRLRHIRPLILLMRVWSANRMPKPRLEADVSLLIGSKGNFASMVAAVVGLLFWVGPAVAQTLDVPVPWIEDGQAAGCGGSRVTGLDPNGDNFLAVRSGPGVDYPKIDELHTGDSVRTCDVRGNWIGIYYDIRGRQQSGWVFGAYLAEVAG
jgi:hypothetical protein